jgi:tRNA(fMet)-specific endonuclease VapC
VNFLLDTNACIALLSGKPSGVRARFQKALANGARLWVSSVAVFELWYGVSKSSREEFNTQRLETFLAGPIEILAFDREDARVAGSIRSSLEKMGKPIGAYDLLIAAQALSRQLTLITANVSEFSRIKGISWQDWGGS